MVTFNDAHSDGDAIVSITTLTRRFGSKLALDDVTLSIPAGTVLGLVGENGAGKTTLIRHVLGLLRAESGTVRVFGLDPAADPAGSAAAHRRRRARGRADRSPVPAPRRLDRAGRDEGDARPRRHRLPATVLGHDPRGRRRRGRRCRGRAAARLRLALPA